MKINRDEYLKPFTKEDFNLQCSFCRGGDLEIIDKTFKGEYTKEAKIRMEFTSDPSGEKVRFVGFLKCANKNCGEVYSFSGTGAGEIDYQCDHDVHDEHVPACNNPSLHFRYDIEYINPPINIISVSEEVPDYMKDYIEESFSLFWGHPSSAGNKIRTVLELILDEKGIKTTGISGKGKKYGLSLHARIEELGKIEKGKYKNLQKMLLSMKWLCNAGSHKEDLEKEDLLDAYEVLDYVLGEIFVRDGELSEAEKTSDRLEKTFKSKSR